MAIGGVEADLGGYTVAVGRGGRGGRRSSAGKVDDNGDEARGRKDPGPKPWMREVDIL